MGRSSNRILVALALTIALAGIAVIAPAGRAASGTSPGSPDPSFGNEGVAIANSTDETAPSEFAAAAAAPDGDVFFDLRQKVIGDENVREIEAIAPTGSPDPSFGKEGKLTVQLGSGLVALPDGDLLIGVETCGGTKGSVLEVDPHGAPVSGFGKEGCGAPPPDGEKGIAVDGKGRVLVLGTANYCPPCGHDIIPSVEALVTRLLPDGSLDGSFGKGGTVGTHVDDHLEVEGYGEGSSEPDGLAADPDGDILISKGGSVIALDEAGAPDGAYGKGGVARVRSQTGPLAVQSDGSAFVVSAEYSDKSATVTKLTPSGQADPTFGKHGAAELPFESQSYVESDPIAVAPGGGVIVGAGILPGKGCVRPCEETPALTRFDAAGRPDSTYGKAGVAAVSLPGARLPEPPRLKALAIAADGTSFAAGTDEGQDAFAAAFTPSGAPLSSFAEDGTLIEHGGREALLESTGLFLSPDGGFTLAAQKSNAPGLAAAFLADFAADGSQQPAADGSLATETLAHGVVVPDGAGRAVAWEDEGKGRALLAAGPAGELLDGGYGKHGSAKFPKGLVPEELVPAPGGGAAVVGTLGHAMAVFRVDPRGRPVPSFGHHGLATVSFPHAKALGLAGVVEADGDVVLTGSVGDYTGAARLLPSGRLDRRYGHGGRVTQLGRHDSYGQLIASSRGGVVIATDRESVPQLTTGLLRLTRHGRIDRSFGHRGLAQGEAERPPLALLAGAGHIVTVTNPTFERNYRGEGVELRAWNADGSVDRSFGKDGVTYFGAGTESRRFNPAAAVMQPDGKIVVAGTYRTKQVGGSYSSIRTQAALVRFLVR